GRYTERTGPVPALTRPAGWGYDWPNASELAPTSSNTATMRWSEAMVAPQAIGRPMRHRRWVNLNHNYSGKSEAGNLSGGRLRHNFCQDARSSVHPGPAPGRTTSATVGAG